MDSKLSPEEYQDRLDEAQGRLGRLTRQAFAKRRSTVVVFEGWDAAGKGGNIRRLTAAIDPRTYRVISIAAPTDEEKAHHYLWRFWRHIPRAGYVTIYDRSWYGRLLVERVEGYARPEEWGRAFLEINDFEQQLVDHGIVLAKFWIHIDEEEQLRRFQEREEVVWKRHKIGPEDWRNREKWGALPRGGERHGGAHQHRRRPVDPGPGKRQALRPDPGHRDALRPPARRAGEKELTETATAPSS